MNPVTTALWNPIVAKEYRSRMRTWRSPLAMTVYILLLGGLGWAIFSSTASAARNSFNGGQAANYGQALFLWLVLFQMVLLAFITPALTAGAVSSERERQTIDLLFVTKLPAFSILWGKLLASMSFVILLLLLSGPIFSLVFLFGGIELDQVLNAFFVTAVTALPLGIIGIACSSALQPAPRPPGHHPERTHGAGAAAHYRPQPDPALDRDRHERADQRLWHPQRRYL